MLLLLLLLLLLMMMMMMMITQEKTPESQCGFRSNRGTVGMIFVLWQIQEKCREQNMGLYTAFVDLTKAFDTISRDGLENPGAPWLSPQISNLPPPAPRRSAKSGDA